MSNIYVDMRSFKRQFVRDTFVDLDEDLFLFYLEQASRDIDNFVGGGEQWRKFYTEYSTKTFYVDNENRDAIRAPAGGYTGYGTQFGYTETWPILIRGQRSLVVPDLLSLDEVSASPRYRNEFDIEDLSGFDLIPFNVNPKLIIRHRVGIFLNANRISVKGKWGYSDERKDTRHTLVGSSLESETDTTLIVNRASGTVPVLQRGQTIMLGSDTTNNDDETVPAEQCYIDAVDGLMFEDDGSVSSSDLMYTLTVQRARNGTVATTYDDGTKIFEPVYPAPIRQSCIDLALRKHRGRDVEWAGIGTEVEGLSDILSPIAAQLSFYRRSKMRIERL